MFVVGDGTRYFMRGCAIRGRVSRKQGRDCIERLGMYSYGTAIKMILNVFENIE